MAPVSGCFHLQRQPHRAQVCWVLEIISPSACKIRSAVIFMLAQDCIEPRFSTKLAQIRVRDSPAVILPAAWLVKIVLTSARMVLQLFITPELMTRLECK